MISIMLVLFSIGKANEVYLYCEQQCSKDEIRDLDLLKICLTVFEVSSKLKHIHAEKSINEVHTYKL